MEDPMQPKKKSFVPVIAGSLVVIVVLVIVVLATHKTSVSDDGTLADNGADTSLTGVNDQPVDTDGPVDEGTGTPDTTAAILYKDGTYSATGSYMTPGGPETIGVKLTLKDDVITDIIVDPLGTGPNTEHFQGLFVANYKPLVIGKKIEDVHLDVVSGSSLTPIGFADALTQIEAQAKA